MLRRLAIAAGLSFALISGGALGYFSHSPSSAGILDPSTVTQMELQTVTSTVTQPPSLLPANSSRCETYVSGHEAAVIIFGGGSQACTNWASNNSSADEFWTSQPQEASEIRRTICTLANGREDIAVQDAGGDAIGNSICGALVREGWVETTNP